MSMRNLILRPAAKNGYRADAGAPAGGGELVIDAHLDHAAPGRTGASRGSWIRHRFHASADSRRWSLIPAARARSGQ